MGAYTDFLEDRCFEILPSDDDYVGELARVTELFRSFDQALDSFLVDHGYTHDTANHENKVTYLASKFRMAGIDVPRNMKKWFTEHKKIERKTAFQICFAFRLGVEETEDFLRRICLQRGFDCHVPEELIYLHGLKQGLNYSEVKNLIERIPKAFDGGASLPEDVVYTGTIADEVKLFSDGEELVEFIKEHRRWFGYRNATAYRYIKAVWSEIACERGLAAEEKIRLYKMFDGRTEESGEMLHRTGKAEEDSLWEIYLQILGLSGRAVSELGTDRSLKPILRDNGLLHPAAEDCFPDRDGLNKILNGQRVSYERVRKVMVLLTFYRFWVRSALRNGSYQAKGGDADRCILYINHSLKDAGYPMLYAGNPFDWIILHALADDFPLVTFREYMQELFYQKRKDEKVFVDDSEDLTWMREFH